jgi:hypothetical protein
MDVERGLEQLLDGYIVKLKECTPLSEEEVCNPAA